MKQDEFERLCSVSAQLRKGLESISSGRVETGRVWVEEAARALNILLRIAESENNKEYSGEMMTLYNAETQVINALESIVCQQQHDEVQIARYFSSDYQQQVDGNCLDYNEFISHMGLLKKLTHSISVSVLAIAAKNNDVLTHHHVYVEKKDGSRTVRLC